MGNTTNITNVTSASDGFISHIMLHSQDFWIPLIVGVILLWGSIMFELYFVWGPQRLKRLFDDVKIKNNGNTCEYPQNPSWLKYSQARTHLKIHGAWRLWENVVSTKKHYEEVLTKVRMELRIIVDRDVWGKVSFDIEPYSGDPNAPSNWYWREILDNEHKNYNLINAIINKSPPCEHGAYLLNSAHTGSIAKTDTKEKREELKGLINAVMKAEETKKLVDEVKEAKDAIGEAESPFKKKLAKIVLDIDYKAGARA